MESSPEVNLLFSGCEIYWNLPVGTTINHEPYIPIGAKIIPVGCFETINCNSIEKNGTTISWKQKQHHTVTLWGCPQAQNPTILLIYVSIKMKMSLVNEEHLIRF